MVEVKDFYILEKRLPAGTGYLVSVWLKKMNIHIRICRPRQTKLGDFRPAHKNLPARITVNSGLHPVEFLLTLTHELAHAENWNLHGRKVKPHGVEWKTIFREKLSQILESGLIEKEFELAIKACYFNKESLATASCPELKRLYDEATGQISKIRLEDIPSGSVFRVSSGKLFVKGEKLRTRYRCREMNSRRIYTVHNMAEIIEFQPPKL